VGLGRTLADPAGARSPAARLAYSRPMSRASGAPLSPGPSVCPRPGPARRAAAHIPPPIAFATKPHLARALVERAIVAGVPFAWGVGDSNCGVGAGARVLRRAGQGYVLASPPPANLFCTFSRSCSNP
jgi:DDE superfamily endonuclease